MEALINPLDKLDCLYSKKKCFQLKNGTFLTGFIVGATLSLLLLLLMLVGNSFYSNLSFFAKVIFATPLILILDLVTRVLFPIVSPKINCCCIGRLLITSELYNTRLALGPIHTFSSIANIY